MLPTGSSTSLPGSSPFPPKSSSPDGLLNGGEGSSQNQLLGHEGYNRSPHDVMQGMQALLNQFSNSPSNSYSHDPQASRHQRNFFASSGPQHDIKTQVSLQQPQPDSKPQIQIKQEHQPVHPPQEAKSFYSIPPLAGPSRQLDPSLELPVPPFTSVQPLMQSSANGSQSHGGLRSDPPKRLYEVDETPIAVPSLDELTSRNTSNQLLLQGDPQFSDKSRVETAIRVIVDILRFCPIPSPIPAIHPSLHPLLPQDASGNILMAFERIATLHGLRLQAGTTTKASSKKQLQAGPISREHLAYVETAVYMSGENGRRVYVCKRCRNREARRRASKEVNRKRHPNSDSDTSSSQPKPRPSLIPPSQDFITGENADQYDPHRNGQVVEEPPWDPDHRDWRHEIVLFNSPPEVKMEDGSCNWLPFRVVCYGKCHGEKVGFKIKFTLRTWDGRIIASSTTKPIRITDDHKTEPKTKPKVDSLTSLTQSSAPRQRKGRQSAASSRRQSPAPSESESVQSFSEAGAVLQKQTPSVRAGKPYERPPSQSPAMSTIPMDNYMSNGFQRHGSTTSLHSLHQHQDVMSQRPAQQNGADFPMQQSLNTVSPGILRGPQFSINSHVELQNGLSNNGQTANTTTVNLTSPPTQRMQLNGHDNMLFGSSMQSPNTFMSTLGLTGQPTSAQPSMIFSNDTTDIEMSSAMTGGLDDIFAGSSHTSISSISDGGSVFSAFGEDRSSAMFSDSGVPPASATDIDQFLDYTGGEHADVSNPFHQQQHHQHLQPDLEALFNMQNQQSQVQHLSQISPQSASHIPPSPFGHLHLSPSANHTDLSPSAQAQQDQTISDMLAAMAAAPPQPQITHVIPGDGPMAGGTKIAIAGKSFSPGMVVVFGQRPASTEFVSDSFVQCKLPPSSFPGEVEVIVQGAIKLQDQNSQLFRYNEMDKDLMRLALEVRNQYNGSSSDAAYRLAHHVATRSATNSEWSERSSSNSPMSGPSPGDADHEEEASDASNGKNDTPNDSLQSTVINFLASIDENAPGSLRASGVINHKNDAKQTLLHIATVMGFHRLVRRLIVVGAHLDIQDINGYTPLAFAALCGRNLCARVLVEAGASYDRPTAYGEMPLDLAKYSEHSQVEALLLSAVWSTTASGSPKRPKAQIPLPDYDGISARSYEGSSVSEIDDDNPSSGSEVEDSLDQLEKIRLSRRKSRKSNAGKSKGKGKERQSKSPEKPRDKHSPVKSRRPSLHSTSTGTTATATAADRRPHPTPTDGRDALSSDIPPPPYAPAELDDTASNVSWMSRTLSNTQKIPNAVWDRLPFPHSMFTSPNSLAEKDAQHHGWIALPAPWETLSKIATNPEEVKLFAQALAAATFNAVVQSGITTAENPVTGTSSTSKSSSLRHRYQVDDVLETKKSGMSRRRKSTGAGGISAATSSALGVMRDGRRSGSASPSEKVVKHVKRDRMLYLFWLPILLFVGFWLMVSALPIATGFCLIYARQITKAIKQRM
ncbi:uncharacterized protein I206_102540 [Kwoniella pini CBS 10737]|uniref:IPT/TIG domain-containing protein n=1 Tax=Kwoniella pini CBS 10737 TaxID=1296096 RepID=A0A1B9I5M6_9TREE|nr:uncharacterized protein I206_02891 [Kwoniella pini CBS 10737]OCF50834.1 hypothetical protein I206_02891 [Kwoniella pini CBS 10737]